MGAIAETRDGSGKQIVYGGTGEANNSADNFYGNGILVSKDGGANWTLTTGPGNAFNRRTVAKIVIDPADKTGGTAYAAVCGSGKNGTGGNTGIWKTTDFGQTWTNTTGNAGLSTTDSWSDVVIDPHTPTTLYAAVGNDERSVNSGVYKSTNGGDTWVILAGTAGGSAGRIALAVYDDGTTNELLVSIAYPRSDSGNLKRMLLSTNGGSNLDQLGNVPDYMAGLGWYATTLAINPKDPKYFYAAGGMTDQGTTFSGSPVESFNTGTNWTDIATLNNIGPHSDSHAVAFDANGNLLEGNDGGIWRLNNPTNSKTQTWSDLNTNLQITQFYGIAVDPTTTTVAYGGSQDNGTEKFTDSLAWTNIKLGDGGIVRVNPTNHNQVYTEQSRRFLYVSDDGGGSFSYIGGRLFGNKVNFFAPYVLDSQGNVYFGEDQLDFSSNQGTSWSVIGKPNVNNFNPNDSTIDSIGVSASDNNVVYVLAGGSVFVTKNAKAAVDKVTWTQVTPSGFTAFPGNAVSLNTLIVDPSDKTGGTAYLVSPTFGSKHVFKTTNFGSTWTDITGNLPNIPVDSVAVSSDGKTVWVGTDAGVYSTSNVNGSSTKWSVFGTGLPNAQIVSLDYVPEQNLLAAGTHGRGMFEFQNLTPPSVTTGSATSISASGATLQATINPNGTSTRARFQYSTDPSFNPTVATTLGSGFSNPFGVAVDAAGDVFVTDHGNNAVKEILPGGTIQTIGSGFLIPYGVAVDAAGDVFVADGNNNAVKEVLPNGSIRTLGSGFNRPAGVAVDGARNVFVADTNNNAVKEVLPDGTIKTIGSGFGGPTGVAVDAAGDVFVTVPANNDVKEILPNGSIRTIGSGFFGPYGVAVDAAGDVFVADFFNNAVKEVLPNGTIKTLGSGFRNPTGVAVDAAGDVFVADYGNNRVVELSPPTVAARPSPLNGTTATAVSAALTGLSPGTTYYYRAVAASAAGTVADGRNPPQSFQTPPAQPRTAPSTAAAGSAASAAPATGNSSTSADLQRLIRDEVFLAVDMALAAQGGLPPAAEAAAIEVLVGDILADPLSHTPGGFLLGLGVYDAAVTAQG
jgi:hypothetical protein